MSQSLTPKELAARWRISQREVPRRTALRQIEFFRPFGSRLIRFRLSEVERIEREHAEPVARIWGERQ